MTDSCLALQYYMYVPTTAVRHDNLVLHSTWQLLLLNCVGQGGPQWRGWSWVRVGHLAYFYHWQFYNPP